MPSANLHLRGVPHVTLVLLLLVPLLWACGDDGGDTPEWAPMELPSQNRPDVRGARGAVSSDHPLATAEGLRVLQAGGTAVDAAVAMAAVLAVVRPHMNGVGGDAFALIRESATGEVVVLNASGSAGTVATPELFFNQGMESIPEKGPLSISVPGAVSGWGAAHSRFGSIPFPALLETAIHYAREGFPVTARLHADILAGSGDLDAAARALYMPDGVPPPVGTLFRNVALAQTLETLAREGVDAFYGGALARRTADFLLEAGGYLRIDDLANHTPFWAEPLEAPFQDHRILVLPPSNQGVALLQQLRLLELLGVPADAEFTDPAFLHQLLEIRKVAFADRDRWVADPFFFPDPSEGLLNDEYLRERAGLVDLNQAVESVSPGSPEDIAPRSGSSVAMEVGSGGVRDGDGDTVYLTVVDSQGNAVSWIQSLFASFGSGVLDPETGIIFQNRGSAFSLDPEHPNVIAPGKRPYHTLSPLLALDDQGELAFTAGTPGGDGQTQTLVQLLSAHLIFGMRPQEAVEAPRFRGHPGFRVEVEDRMGIPALEGLHARGHALEVLSGWNATFGGAQMIRVEPGSGTLTVASDPRREAYGLAW
ncbi:MAG: gamma-glutamyltransferase [Gemmatimonadota bacterium]